MGKILDITDKLTFDSGKQIKVKDFLININSDAPTMLKIMALLDDERVGAEAFVEAYELLFNEEDREKIDSLKLEFDDFKSLIVATVKFVAGGTVGE